MKSIPPPLLTIHFKNANNGRFYILTIEMDLLGDILVVSFYGSQRRQYVASGIPSALQRCRDVIRKRIRNGYTITSQFNSTDKQVIDWWQQSIVPLCNNTADHEQALR